MDATTHDALREDGDGYHSRNYEGVGTIADPVFGELELLHQMNPITSLLEIGCSTGFRLEKARKLFGCVGVGLEISEQAHREGTERYPEVTHLLGGAPGSLKKLDTDQFDTIILGHFQYLLPREDIFALAYQVDRLLKSGGYIIANDFFYIRPMSAPYSHSTELTIYKDDPTAPWTWSPTYTLVSRKTHQLHEDLTHAQDPTAWQTLDIVRKNFVAESYPQANTQPSIHDRSE